MGGEGLTAAGACLPGNYSMQDDTLLACDPEAPAASMEPPPVTQWLPATPTYEPQIGPSAWPEAQGTLALVAAPGGAKVLQAVSRAGTAGRFAAGVATLGIAAAYYLTADRPAASDAKPPDGAPKPGGSNEPAKAPEASASEKPDEAAEAPLSEKEIQLEMTTLRRRRGELAVPLWRSQGASGYPRTPEGRALQKESLKEDIAEWKKELATTTDPKGKQWLRHEISIAQDRLAPLEREEGLPEIDVPALTESLEALDDEKTNLEEQLRDPALWRDKEAMTSMNGRLQEIETEMQSIRQTLANGLPHLWTMPLEMVEDQAPGPGKSWALRGRERAQIDTRLRELERLREAARPSPEVREEIAALKQRSRALTAPLSTPVGMRFPDTPEGRALDIRACKEQIENWKQELKTTANLDPRGRRWLESQITYTEYRLVTLSASGPAAEIQPDKLMLRLERLDEQRLAVEERLHDPDLEIMGSRETLHAMLNQQLSQIETQMDDIRQALGRAEPWRSFRPLPGAAQQASKLGLTWAERGRELAGIDARLKELGAPAGQGPTQVGLPLTPAQESAALDRRRSELRAPLTLAEKGWYEDTPAGRANERRTYRRLIQEWKAELAETSDPQGKSWLGRELVLARRRLEVLRDPELESWQAALREERSGLRARLGDDLMLPEREQNQIEVQLRQIEGALEASKVVPNDVEKIPSGPTLGTTWGARAQEIRRIESRLIELKRLGEARPGAGKPR